MSRFSLFLIAAGLITAILSDSMKNSTLIYVGLGVMILGGILLILIASDVIWVKKSEKRAVYCPKCHHRLPNRGFRDHCPNCGCKFTIGKMDIRVK